MPLQLCASERGERSRKYFRARGSAQVIDKAQFGQGNPRKTEPFSWIVFTRAWPDLAEFGFGLDRAWPNFNTHNMESVHANIRRGPGIPGSSPGTAMTLNPPGRLSDAPN